MNKRNRSIRRGLLYCCGLSDWMFSPKERYLLKPHSVPGQKAPWVPITSPNLSLLINPILLLGKLTLSEEKWLGQGYSARIRSLCLQSSQDRLYSSKRRLYSQKRSSTWTSDTRVTWSQVTRSHLTVTWQISVFLQLQWASHLVSWGLSFLTFKMKQLHRMPSRLGNSL